MKMERVIYNHNNKEYEVNEPYEIHMKLQTDETYCAQYFANLSTYDATESHVDDTECIDDSDNDSKALWDRKSTKMMLAKYLERLSKFRNPKFKKSRLWKEMETEMKALGYSKINAHSIDRKMRNMKSTYKRIKNNKKKTGRGREDWVFYNEMDEIFNMDKSVNFEEGISSMESGQDSTNEALDFSKHSDLESSSERPSTSLSNVFDEQSSILNDETSTHDASTRDSNEGTPLNKKKLYNQRNKAIELELRKINILESIEKKQESKNMIEKQLERFATALETKNELAKKKIDILEKKNELLYMLLKSKNDTSK
ncbi:PREDICTED: uncharacterized protein LOC105555777 isoform X2 [Vollenhovia emeryi]|uniref:uncharacterized protein LOC105555777 isoform X2 n=1 Tax=Vollenhovia emeryi TaxID=411798 RepID=UPI0005F4E9B4|nr:PREDICTED: uncharacterized protein LOC105555777 isoform X2 [Vollenhovia emeryi]